MENNKKLKNLYEEDHKNELELRKANPNLMSLKDLPTIGAFVIFNEVLDKERAKKDYRRYHYPCLVCKKYNPDHMIKGMKVTIIDAVEPSNVLWENLEVKGVEKFLRTVAVTIFVIILMLVTFIMIYGIKSY
jgi:hypothetical protein